jgi:hypothetical protein
VALPLSGRKISTALKVATVLTVLLLAPPGAFQTASPRISGVLNTIYPSTSWGLGIVVPEGARLAGDGDLRWESVGNLSALVALPSFDRPSGIVYAVLSVMAEDGSVMQVAAGVYPNSSSWTTYSWVVEGMQTSSPIYDWILNSSAPVMRSGDAVALSIFRNSTRWETRVVDLDSGSSRVAAFPAGIAPSLGVGDQEAFALESYSRAAVDFEHMGNLTLTALLVDGRRVTGGFYSYGGWDPSKNPAFVVGSSGTNPPVFIDLQQNPSGNFVWSYLPFWPGGTFNYSMVLGVFIAVGMVGVAFAVLAAALVTRKRPEAKPAS